MCRKMFLLVSFVLVLSIAGNASADLVVHWNFDEGSGTTALDSSGNGYDGEFIGEPQWVEGHGGGGALEFDGNNDSLLYPLEEATAWPAFSITFWVKATTLGQFNYSSPFSGHYPNSAGFQIDVDGGNPGRYRIFPGGLIFGTVSTDWVHLAIIAEGKAAKLYYNGELTNEGTLSDSIINQFRLGQNRKLSQAFACTIDEFRMYDHAISEVEVLSAFSGQVWPYAFGPGPADGAIYANTWASISWGPGDYATSHDVYFSDNFDDVDAGAEGTFRGNQAETYFIAGFPGFAYPDGLVPGTTYYWRIDEVNDTEPNSPWKGSVWSFSIPPKTAYNPEPADGAKFIESEADLSWTGGFGAKLYTVYFGDNFDDVNNATSGQSQVTATYTPKPLELATTYYWRVDEFDVVEMHKGNVWSFTTAGEGGGVKGEYFKGMDFGSLALTRIDPQIDFIWGNGEPDPAVGADNFSVRWTGEVEAAFTETYTFYTNSDDGVRLWIDGQQIVNNWTDHPPTEDIGTIDLVAGNTYRVVMEMYENGSGAVAELRWSSPHTPKQLIPQAALSLPVKASGANLSNGAADVSQIAILSWSAGETAASHDVYFGTDVDAVKNADTSSPEYKGSRQIDSESYDPGKLEWDTTYYWRVDEIEDGGIIQKGNVWSFTTANFLIVDNMESYNDINEGEPGSNRIYLAWVDGLNNPAINGSVVGYATAPFAEQTIVHSGNQSMPFAYDNGVGKSEATLTLTYPSDWTEKGVDTLTIWYIGDAANAAETMYVVLNGSAGVDNVNPNASLAEDWTEWPIDLQAFADQGVNLSNVNTITLGLGNRTNPVAGGSGMMYFDDIRLYAPVP